MNFIGVLSLLGDLYAQIEALQKENEDLKAKLREADMAAIRPGRLVHADPLAGPGEAIAQARQGPEGKK